MSQPFTGRVEGALKVTGTAVYEGETSAPGLLHAALVEAPVAHGRVVAIDVAGGRALPGVVDIVTREDAATLRPSSNTTLIQTNRLHFAGQAVALVVAETSAAARAAATRVAVTVEEAPAITSMRHAAAVFYAPEMAGRRARAASLRGDPAAALATAPHVVRARYATAANNHHPMEPHAGVCWWEGERAIAHTCTQGIFGTRAVIAHAFGLPRENVRVVSRYLGGGFGCKGQLWFPWLLWTLLAARRAGRPVRLELTRPQLFTLVGRRSETMQELGVAADHDGRLLAIDHQVQAQTATHGEHADPVAAVSRLVYACPNVVTGHRLAATNEPLPIPMRGPGEAPGSFALESAMDELAETLAIDPVELRLRNIADHDQESALPWSSNGLAACLRTSAERFGWSGRARRGWREGGQRVGWGMAVACYPARRQPCALRLRLDGDGRLVVECGTQDMGSGTITTLAQMASERMGVPIDRVSVAIGDTSLPEGPISAGSQVTQSIAPAVAEAAADLRRALAELLAGEPGFAGVAPDALAITPDGLVRRHASNAACALADLLAAAGLDWVEGNARTSGPEEQPTATSMGFGAVFAEVAVDADTAEARVRRLTAAYAAGRIVNPVLARGQFIGGLIGGIGMALHEETRGDPRSGRIIGANLAEYVIPAHADMPVFDVVTVEEHDAHLPDGIKGVGMLGHVGTGAAIANAIYQATGTRVRHLPIRVEDLL